MYRARRAADMLIRPNHISVGILWEETDESV